MKTDHEMYQDIAQDIIDGKAVILREGVIDGIRVQYIVRMMLDHAIITHWQCDAANIWRSIPMSWLTLAPKEIASLREFFNRFN